MKQKCYDYFGCKRHNCPMFAEGEERDCWEVPGTLNNRVDGMHLGSDGLEKKETFCRHCLYYKHRHEMSR